MSYKASLVDNVFVVERGKQNAAYEALLSIEPSLPDELENPLRAALASWNYESEMHTQTGDITRLIFHGKELGDARRVFEAIAPYVGVGSYLQYQGEDGARWRWVFTDEKMVEVLIKRGSPFLPIS